MENFSCAIPDRPNSKLQRPQSAKQIYEGKLFTVWQWQQKLFDGHEATYEMLQRPDTVLVLPVINGEILFAEEMQPGMQQMLRSLGGRIEPGENPCDAVQRELMEESGYYAAEFRLWDAWQPVNKIDWAVYLFVAHRLKSITSPNLDAGEMISIKRIPIHNLFERNTKLNLDDYELMHKIYHARSDLDEYDRIMKMLTP